MLILEIKNNTFFFIYLIIIINLYFMIKLDPLHLQILIQSPLKNILIPHQQLTLIFLI